MELPNHKRIENEISGKLFEPLQRLPLTRMDKIVMRRKQEREKYGLVANLNGCRFLIVRKIIEEAGFKTDDGENLKSAYLIWTDCFISFEKLLNLRPYQRVNHFPGMIEICRKDFLAKNFNKQAKLNPLEYDYIPRTWVLPQEHGLFFSHAKRYPHAAYIMKPANGAMGHGIRLYKNPENVPTTCGTSTTCVIQEYVMDPLLVDGFKCDLRVYVLVTSCCPLRVFVYNDGLVRLSAEKYLDPVDPNSESMYRHLTNYAVNKRHSSYIKSSDDAVGSKRSFSFLETYIRDKLQADPQVVWRRIRNLIVKTLIIGAPHINHAYRLFHRSTGRATNVRFPASDAAKVAAAKVKTPRKSQVTSELCSSRSRAFERKAWNMMPQHCLETCDSPDAQIKIEEPCRTGIRSAAFEILGVDILLDKNLRPWLLEVNRSPSFGCDQELDLRVKSGVLRDALHLINIRPSDKRHAEETMKAHSIRRLLTSTSIKDRPHVGASPGSVSTNSKNNTGRKVSSRLKSRELATDWLKNPTELKQRIRDLRERIREMHQESELECFENANCGNWRRVYPTSDKVLEQRYARLLNSAFIAFNKGKEGDLIHVIQISQAGGRQVNVDAVFGGVSEFSDLGSSNEFNSTNMTQIPLSIEDELRQQLEFFEKEAQKLQTKAPAKLKPKPSKMGHCQPFDSDIGDFLRTNTYENPNDSSTEFESSSDTSSSEYSNDQNSWSIRRRMIGRYDTNSIVTERALASFRAHSKELFSPGYFQQFLPGGFKRRTHGSPGQAVKRF